MRQFALMKFEILKLMTLKKQTLAGLIAAVSVQFAILCADPFLPRALTQESTQQLVLQTVDGKRLQGTIDRIDESGRITGTGIGDNQSLDSVVSIETGKRVFAVKQRAEVYLVGATAWGEAKVGAAEVTIEDEQVSLTGRIGKFQLPLQSVRAILWRDSETVQQAIAQPSTENDRVIVDVDGSPQTVNGIVEAVTPESVSVNYKGKLRSIGIAKINAIVLADVGYQAPAGVLASVLTTEGDRFFGLIKSWSDDSQKAVLTLAINDEKNTIPIPVKRIAEIQIKSDRLMFLSKVEPMGVSETTDFVEARPFQRDHSVTGGKLQIRGSDNQPIVFSNGIGSQATSELVYANDKKFNRLLATVGIDLATKGRGDCRVVVKTDGFEVFNQQLTALGDPIELDVDVANADQVSLVVLPGREFDLADHVVWGNVRLLNTKDAK